MTSINIMQESRAIFVRAITAIIKPKGRAYSLACATIKMAQRTNLPSLWTQVLTKRKQNSRTRVATPHACQRIQNYALAIVYLQCVVVKRQVIIETRESRGEQRLTAPIWLRLLTQMNSNPNRLDSIQRKIIIAMAG